MAYEQRDLEKWLRKVMFIPRPEGPPFKIALKHVTLNGKMGGEIAALFIPEDPLERQQMNEEWVRLTAQEFFTNAQNDASGLGPHPQAYLVQAFWMVKNEEVPLTRFSLRIAGSDPEEEEGLMASEPPTPTGLLSQLMRHQEATLRTAVSGMAQVTSTLRQQNASLSDMVEKMMEDRFKNMELVEDLRSRKHERDLESAHAANREEMFRGIADKLMLLLPVAVQKLTGKSLPPGPNGTSVAPSTSEVMIKAFMETVTPDQFEALQGVLKPEQLIVLAELFQAMQRAEQKPAENHTDNGVS